MFGIDACAGVDGATRFGHAARIPAACRNQRYPGLVDGVRILIERCT